MSDRATRARSEDDEVRRIFAISCTNGSETNDLVGPFAAEREDRLADLARLDE